MKTLAQLESDLTNATTETEKIDLLNLISLECEKSDRPRMIKVAEEVYARSAQSAIADRPYYTGLVFSLAMQSSYWRGYGDPARAFHLLQEAQHLIETYEKEVALPSQITLYSYLGAAYCELGDYVNALNYQLQAAALCDRIESPRAAAIVLAEIARIYGTAKESERQIEYFEKSLSVLREVGDDLNVARYHAMYVEALIDAGRHDEALEQGQRMLAQSRQLQFLQGEMAALQKIGKIYMQRQAYVAAQPYFVESCALARRSERAAYIFENLVALSYNSIALLHYDQALIYSNEALTIACKNNSLQQQYESHKLLATLFGLRGNFEEAYRHHQLYYEFFQKVHGEEANKQRRFIEVRYETESAKKEAMFQKQKNEALEVEIERRKRAEAELLAANLELQRVQIQLETLSQTDDLTQLANRRYFDKQLTYEIEQAQRKGLPLALVLLDLDHFKGINDSRGHQIGDDYLVKIAQTLRNHVRKTTDIVARYGGEEFGMILVDTTREESIAIVERLRASVAALGLVNEESSTGYQTISGGIATMTPHASISPQELILQADRALYEAKRGGRNRIVTV